MYKQILSPENTSKITVQRMILPKKVGGFSKRYTQIFNFFGDFCIVSFRQDWSGVCLSRCIKHYIKSIILCSDINSLQDLLKIIPSAYVIEIDLYGNSTVLSGSPNSKFRFALHKCHWNVILSEEEIAEDPKLSKISERFTLKYKVLITHPDKFVWTNSAPWNILNVFYDLETVLKQDHEFHVYQIGYKFPGSDVKILSGFDWMLWFVSEIRNYAIANDANVWLISYNGSWFDDIFLFRECLDTGIFVNGIFQNNSILSLNISGDVKCWDLARFLSGSLSKNCDAFQTRIRKV